MGSILKQFGFLIEIAICVLAGTVLIFFLEEAGSNEILKKLLLCFLSFSIFIFGFQEKMKKTMLKRK